MTQLRAFSLAGASVVGVVLLLVGNGLWHGPSQNKDVKVGPAGFPQKIQSLGLVETAFVGPVSLVAEDRILQPDGSFRRQPSLVVNGRDPSPVNQLMRIHEVHIRALGEPGSSELTRYEVRGVFADLPLEEGSAVIALDRNQTWQIQEPRFFFPQWGRTQGLTLKAPTADLNPLNGDIFCPGNYVLEASGLLMEGIGLRLKGETGSIFFGETQGKMQWSLQTSNGQFVGANDGGGSLIQGEEFTTLFLFSKEYCHVDFPKSSALAGNLTTQGFEFLLESKPKGWQPQELRGQTPSTWTDWRGQLQGQHCLALWEQGEMQKFELFGPLQGEWADEGWPKITARQKALFLSENGFVELFGNVEAKQIHEGKLVADWAQLSPQAWKARGNVNYYSSKKGTLLAEEAHYQKLEGIRAWGNVIAKPVQAHIDKISAPSMRWLERGDFFIDEPFVMEGSDEVATWTMHADQLESRQFGNDYHSIASGKVRWDRGDLTAHGNKLIHRGGRHAVLSGKPAWATFPVKDGVATARGARFVLADETFHIQTNPEVFLPASSLGLAGETVRVRSKFMTRAEDGTWEFKNEVSFEEALVGTAGKMTWSPLGTLNLEADESLASLDGEFIDGKLFSAKAKQMEWKQNGELVLTGDVDACRKSPNEVLHICADKVTFGQSSGSADGRVEFKLNQDTGEANHADWTSDQGGFTVNLRGNAKLNSADGRAKGHSITRGPQFLTVESLPPADATLALANGRQILGPWIQWDHLSLLLTTLKAVVEGQKH